MNPVPLAKIIVIEVEMNDTSIKLNLDSAFLGLYLF